MSYKSDRYSPTALFAVDRPFRIMLAVLQVGLQLIQPQGRRTPETSVVTADLELGQHVAHDAGYRTEVSEGHYGAVHWADLLLGKPLRDTRIAECMFTVGGLECRQTRHMNDKKVYSWNWVYFKHGLACTGSSSTPLHMGHSRSSSTSPWNLVTSYPMVHHGDPEPAESRRPSKVC